ncbi:hypothetical protein BDV93DRAFT_521068 [Ceratobasidium sp. AG-I]|nr:hypothetical protein BDV93DRAFT_521068 [Ceratobasidium sp. AG-I]
MVSASSSHTHTRYSIQSGDITYRHAYAPQEARVRSREVVPGRLEPSGEERRTASRRSDPNEPWNRNSERQKAISVVRSSTDTSSKRGPQTPKHTCERLGSPTQTKRTIPVQFRLSRGNSSDKSPRVTFSDELEYVVDGQPTPVRAEVVEPQQQLVSCRAGSRDDPRPGSISAAVALPHPLGSGSSPARPAMAEHEHYERDGMALVPTGMHYLPSAEYFGTPRVEHDKQLRMDSPAVRSIPPPPMEAFARVNDRARPHLHSHHRHSAPEYGYEPACFVQGKADGTPSKLDRRARDSTARSVDVGRLQHGKGRSSPLRTVRFEDTGSKYSSPSSRMRTTTLPSALALPPPPPTEYHPPRPSLAVAHRRDVIVSPVDKVGKSEYTFVDLMRAKIHRMRTSDSPGMGAVALPAGVVPISSPGLLQNKADRNTDALQARQTAKRDAERREREESHARGSAKYERRAAPAVEVDHRRESSSRSAHPAEARWSAPGTASEAYYPVPTPQSPMKRTGDIPAQHRSGRFFRTGRYYSSNT